MTKKYVTYAMMTALTLAISMWVIIPIPGSNGFVSLIDAGIFTSALLFGPMGGFFVGALSGGLLDVISGYFQWTLFSFLIHGAQGWLAGKFLNQSAWGKIIGLIFASAIMVFGYFLTSWFMYGLPVALAAIPSDSIQTLVGAAIALPLSQILRSILPKHILNSQM